MLGLLAALGCRADEKPAPAHVVIELPRAVLAESIQLKPDRISQHAVLLKRRLLLTLSARQAPPKVTLQVPNACPLVIDRRDLEPGKTRYLELKPWIDLGEPRPELGFDAQFSIKVIAGCPEARAGKVSWRQVEGKPLKELRIRERGFVLSARTPSFAELFGNTKTIGIVPVSPRTQGGVVLEAVWQGSGSSLTERLRLSSVSRARGLPNVATDASVLLGGDDWRLVSGPEGAKERLHQGHGYSSLRPRTSGKWRLVNPRGQELSLFSAPYDQVPLDCARSNCHEAQQAQTLGGMSNILVRGLDGKLGASYSLECAVACHAVGEPGLDDGGFHHVADELGVNLHTPATYLELPPALKRLGNVGCLGCHGPGAIPEAGARHGILRADVCAYCHDAPPRYGHVAAWRDSAMSRADRVLRARMPGNCADCHSTWGFLVAQGGVAAASRPAPTQFDTGISCAACHAVHQTTARPSLLRDVELPKVAEHLEPGSLPSSRICLGCHAPKANKAGPLLAWPEASASALWLGRGGFADSGEALEGPAVHATTADGCLTCHRGLRDAYARGANHSFKAAADSCTDCHDKAPQPPPIGEQARALLSRLLLSTQGAWVNALRELFARKQSAAEFTPHATPGRLNINEPSGRAAYNLLLILEDPAASVHNPGYAKLLLDHAARMLDHIEKPITRVKPARTEP